MTRINLIPPADLKPKHLLAEYRELPRIPGLVRKAQMRGLGPCSVGIPRQYCLGKGHVKFFYDKLFFLNKRYTDLVAEMRVRGFTVNFPTLNLNGLERHWMGDYEPTPQAIQMSIMRIEERMSK